MGAKLLLLLYADVSLQVNLTMLNQANTPLIMGILNCTPDSFFCGSRTQTDSEIAARANAIISEGGSIIDIGAYSTRPGAAEVSEEEEMRRLRGALEVVRREQPEAVLSVDTFRPSVARMAVREYGVQIVNDVSEGQHLDEMAALGATYVLMSRQPDMATTLECFAEKVARLRELGCRDIILDPGFGFGKDVIEGNYAMLRDLHRVKEAFPELPLLAGMSRKRMIYQLLGCTPESDRTLQGTMLANLMALQQGADILRVHDVKAAADTVRIGMKSPLRLPQGGWTRIAETKCIR